jgi:hemerythrin superfamily protein
MTPTRDGDVVDLLVGQHARIEELFIEVLAGGGDRRAAVDELIRLLAVHETAEEEIVHPVARHRIDAGDEVVDALLAEEHDAKQMLAWLQDLDPADPRFQPLVGELRTAVLRHAKHEERYEFNQLRAKVDAERLRAMATGLRAAEALAPTRPHPGMETAGANVALGLPMAVADRVRDLLRDARRE